MENVRKKVYIETLGCQMNKSDSERILAILEHFGYDEVDEPKEADFLIVEFEKFSQCQFQPYYSSTSYL